MLLLVCHSLCSDDITANLLLALYAFPNPNRDETNQELLHPGEGLNPPSSTQLPFAGQLPVHVSGPPLQGVRATERRA